MAKYPTHLEFLGGETLDEVDFNFKHDHVTQRVECSQHHVKPKFPQAPWRTIVAAYRELTARKWYPKVGIARYRRRAGEWHCVALIKCHPDEVEDLCRALREARDALRDGGYA